jgi:DNA-directed RNA polymerase subunit alpha
MKNLNDYPAMNPVFTLTEAQSTANQATIVIEPLENGYGHTVGNALRRILLTSLPGAAVTKVRIDGVDHEYSSLEGVSEDVVEILLNVKELRIKATVADQGTLKLSAKGEGEVTAEQIDCGDGFEITNPDKVIATLAKGKKLDMEMTVETGYGYVMAKDMETDVIGEIPVDALFSPVVKVSYEVEDTRVGSRTDYDRVIFQITTDGSITPKEAVEQAARILARQATQVFDPIIPEVEETEESLSPEELETLRLTVEELDLPTRIANALRKGGFETVADLDGASRAVISKVKNLGGKSVEVIEEALDKKGVKLGE